MMDPVVSIVTPAFNSEKFIGDCLGTVSDQTFSEWEHIIVDDGSSDSTRELLKVASERDYRVVPVFLDSNSGAAVARNNGIDIARGKYIAFLDADDLWDKDKLLRQIEFMEDGAIDFSFTPYRALSPNGNVQIVDSRSISKVNKVDLLMKQVTMGCSTVIVRRECVGQMRMPNIRRAQDYAFWLLLLDQIPFALKYHEPLSSYRILPGSVSRNKVRKAFYQFLVYHKYIRLPLYKSFYYFLYYAKNAIIRK